MKKLFFFSQSSSTDPLRPLPFLGVCSTKSGLPRKARFSHFALRGAAAGPGKESRPGNILVLQDLFFNSVF